MKKVALVGCGIWGRNYVNTIRGIPDLKLKYICDVNLPKVQIPEGVLYTDNLREVLGDKEIGGVMIVTPTKTHYDLSLQAIRAGKSVLVEKPMTTSYKEAQILCEEAEKNKVNLMVGHIFKYNNAIKDIKKRIDSGEIGDLRYIESRRVGLGPIRQDVSVLWDFATHDIYIATYLTGNMPNSVNCVGENHSGKLEDIISLNMKFPDKVFVSIYANWEHPIKERKIIIGGTKKAILFNDINPSEKIEIYERSVDYFSTSSDFGGFQASIREGDIIIPKIKLFAPLEEEIKHFDRCLNGEKCLSGGYEGMETIKILEAAERSKNHNGKEIILT